MNESRRCRQCRVVADNHDTRNTPVISDLPAGSPETTPTCATTGATTT